MRTILISIFMLAGPVSIPFSSLAAPAQKTPKIKTDAAKKAATKKEKKPVPVEIKTSMGTIEAELYPDKAPLSVENFKKYIEKKFYDSLVFHRVIDNFMIQGGGFDKNLSQRPTDASIHNEANNGLKNDKGTLAMARTPNPHSATSQFYINLQDNDFLNYKNPAEMGYAVFGKVTKGMDVVEKIGKVETTSSPTGMRDVPKVPVVIESIRLIDAKKESKAEHHGV